MYKQISFILFGIILLIGTIQSARISNLEEDELFNFLNRSKRASNDEQQRFQQQMLTAHNKFRARHCVSSLRLDDNLSRAAQNYAQILARTNTFKHSGTKGVGENLYMFGSSNKITNVDGATATQSWYDEVKLYNYANGGFSMATGHFTQVVWKGSQKLGAGFAYNSDHTKVYVVAQYSPPGNFLGQFTENVLPPRC